jgi:hypothetical protein
VPSVFPPPLNVGLLRSDGNVSELWSRFFLKTQTSLVSGTAPADARYWVGQSNGDLTNEFNLASLAAGHLSITVALGIATPTTSTTIPAADLTGTLPALNGSALTALNAAVLTGTLPALNASALTTLNASNLSSGTVPDARFPATLPAASGVNLTALKATALTYAVVVVTFAMSPYVVLASDNVLLVNATGGAVTLTLPAATSGRILTVKKTDVSANLVTLTGTVDTVVNPTLGTQFQSRVIQADGSNWQILAGYL